MIVTFHRGSAVAFGRHVDHAEHAVSYVTDPLGAEILARSGDRPAALAVVDDPVDRDAVCRAAAALAERIGTPDAVFAPHEYDLLDAARVRDRIGVRGMSRSLTLDCRDKVRMKRKLRAGGVATPAFVACDSRAAVPDLVREVGFPLVLKPRQGGGSRGVMVIADESSLARAWSRIDPDAYECEQFVAGPIHHVDGLRRRGRLTVSQVSRYVNTCFQSAHGLPHGSVVVDDPSLSRRLTEFAAGSLAALGLDDSAFHLELILRDGTTPVFLEVGARLGGGEIVPVVEEVYGVDLLRAWIDLQLGGPPAAELMRGAVGGWLVAPRPCEPPYRIVGVERLAGRIPHLYAERLPRPGEVHDRSNLRANRWPGGSFRYRGPSTAAVESAITESIRRYRLEAVRLGG
jgi:hypothetical protein